ncbi:hypothetical protein [Balneola sp. MJW-20]|uniref:hypothetical protein n=1 Tax=Gracilimonas aurantiaca TaxID=3234185 RepID=UPI003466E98F
MTEDEILQHVRTFLCRHIELEFVNAGNLPIAPYYTGNKDAIRFLHFSLFEDGNILDRDHYLSINTETGEISVLS